MKIVHITIALMGLAVVGQNAFSQGRPKKKAAPAADGSTETTKTVRTSSGGESWGPPYGMAGCGLGGYAVGTHNTKMAQLGATTLNGYSYNQSSAITSGTSNCDKNPADMQTMEQEVFISVNRNNLQAEAVQGQGETLKAFAELVGCNESDKDAKEFAEFCKSNYVIFSHQDAKTILSSFKETIRKESNQLAERCSRV